jgi:hypothetical protein
MNSSRSQRQTVEPAKAAMHCLSGVENVVSFAAGILFVYEQSCARRENLSSALQAEKQLCRIKLHLPRIPVQKPGNRFSHGDGRLARLYTNGILDSV